VGKPPPIPAAKSLPSQSSNHAKLGPDLCTHVLYFDLVVPNAQTAGLDHVGCYHLSLTWVMEALFKVDNTISLFPYGLPQSSECNILKMGSTLGESVSQLSSYFDGLCLARDAYPQLFVSILLGFNSKDDLFVPNCQAQLNCMGVHITLRPLQCAKVFAAGWVFGTHSDMDPALSKTIHEALDSYYPGNDICLGFQLKQLWSGAKKTEPASSPKPSSTPSHTHTPGLCVVHIDCEHNHEAAAKAMIGAVLHLPYFSSYSNLPLCLIDILHFNSSEEECNAFASAYKRQSNISSSLSWVNSQDFLWLDLPISQQAPFDGASLCQLILQMKNQSGNHIFMSVNQNWNGAGYVLSFPTLYQQEAQHRVLYGQVPGHGILRGYLLQVFLLSCCHCQTDGMGCCPPKANLCL